MFRLYFYVTPLAWNGQRLIFIKRVINLSNFKTIIYKKNKKGKGFNDLMILGWVGPNYIWGFGVLKYWSGLWSEMKIEK